ncbi:MAG: flippase [Cyanobacteria bacterium]|nr:flippase [Cyanobacteriota bacterium]
MSTALVEKLTHKKLLLKNIFFNFGMHGLTMLIGLITVPMIIKGMGTDRFGILTIIWVLIGYSSLLDFGLGRALTQDISKKIGLGKTTEIAETIWTALFVIAILGAFSTLIMCLSAETLVTFFKVPKALYTETVNSMYALAVAMPFFLLMCGLKGVLESYQRFAIISALRFPILITNYVAPLWVFTYSHSLYDVVWMLALGRIITFIGHYIAVAIIIEDFHKHIGLFMNHLKPLLKFGGWVTITAIVTPFMTYLDRCLISFLLTSQVVAYYATSYDVISKINIVPTAIMSVMFPALTTEFIRNVKRTKGLYYKTMLYIFLILVVPIGVILVFAKPLIAAWIDQDFAEKSYLVAQLLSVGFLISSINVVPYSMLQAIGRSDLTAKIHMTEFPFYLVALYFFITQFGMIGAPLTFIFRITLDSILLHVVVHRYFNKLKIEERVEDKADETTEVNTISDPNTEQFST